MRIKLTVSYDGSRYFGFQHQNDVLNIEDIILAAIKKIDSSVDKIYGSGRTDRHVHAKGQVIHFDSEKEILEYHVDSLRFKKKFNKTQKLDMNDAELKELKELEKLERKERQEGKSKFDD
mgnify:CR=1 FL=1